MPMPKPKEGETEKEFVARFMADETMLKDYPDEKQRAAVAYSTFRERKNSTSDWPKKYSCNFIEPGLISYEDQNLGKCLVNKDVLDKMAVSMEGKPVVLRKYHKDGMNPKDFEDVAGGMVSRVWWNETDSWYWCDFFLWDDELRKQVEKENYSVSCAYKVLKSNNEGGIHNNIKFDQEILDGEYVHLAIVENPRYSGARVVFNSTGGETMIKIWPFGKKKENKNALEPETEVDVDGKKVQLKHLMEAYLAECAEAEAAAKEEKPEEVADGSTVEIGGKKVSMKDMIAAFKKRNAAPVETEEEKKKREAKEAEAKAAADEETKKKAESEVAAAKKAEAEAEEKKKKDAEAEASRKNEAARLKHFEVLKNAAGNRNIGEYPNSDITTVEEKRTRGKDLYGSISK